MSINFLLPLSDDVKGFLFFSVRGSCWLEEPEKDIKADMNS